jgi:hypothetical protein
MTELSEADLQDIRAAHALLAHGHSF